MRPARRRSTGSRARSPSADRACYSRGVDEAAIREAARAGRLAEAATAALELYGGELFGFLRGIARNDALADDAFGATCEKLWRGLAEFRWEASLRSWLYTIARRALADLRDHAHRRANHLPLSQVDALAAQIRSATLPILRTEVKDGFRALRAELPAEDHELLMLRIDRQLSWRDIARILGEAEGAGDADLDQRAANLRKRFERAKLRLRKLAISRGLLED